MGESLYGLPEIQSDAFLHEVFMDEGCHGEVDGCHHLWRHLDNRHLRSGMCKVLCHLESDESTSDDDGSPDILLLHIRLDSVRVLDIAQCEYSL